MTSLVVDLWNDGYFLSSMPSIAPEGEILVIHCYFQTILSPQNTTK
jgi:hypothetical protein